jgi:hypothetical protein
LPSFLSFHWRTGTFPKRVVKALSTAAGGVAITDVVEKLVDGLLLAEVLTAPNNRIIVAANTDTFFIKNELK